MYYGNLVDVFLHLYSFLSIILNNYKMFHLKKYFFHKYYFIQDLIIKFKKEQVGIDPKRVDKYF